jgi:hypothetical protein
MKRKRKRKTPSARTPMAGKKCKELFIAQLAKGCAPGAAARNVNIARCTAYKWKKEDEEFDAAWVDAVETALDQIETDLYDEAHVKKNVVAMQFILRHRRKAVYGGGEEKRKDDQSDFIRKDDQSDFIKQIPLAERIARLQRLGVPVMIESDIEKAEEIDAGDAHS